MKQLLLHIACLCVAGVTIAATIDKINGADVTTATNIQGNVVGTFQGQTLASSGFPLAGWDKRIKITIDSSVVDAQLTNFPVMVKISTASGIGDTNNTAVFTEVGQNSLKIAMTSSDETTELYVEIEKWDGTNAWIWFKAPLIASGSDTDFYFYYDNDHADNTNYVATAGVTVATNVWDSDYAGVWHIAQTGTLDRIDSTFNANDGAPQNYDGDENVVGQIDGSDNLDGVDQYIDGGTDGSVLDLGSMTYSIWAKVDNFDTGDSALITTRSGTLFGKFLMCRSKSLIFLVDTDGAAQVRRDTDDINGLQGVSTHFAATWDGGLAATNMHVYVNGAEQTYALTQNGVGNIEPDQQFLIGTRWLSSALNIPVDGTIDEARVSDSVRSCAYIKAEYNAGNDSLVTYGPEEIP